jgi:hypothetical protein
MEITVAVGRGGNTEARGEEGRPLNFERSNIRV